jgi:hypothetical protein
MQQMWVSKLLVYDFLVEYIQEEMKKRAGDYTINNILPDFRMVDKIEEQLHV